MASSETWSKSSVLGLQFPRQMGDHVHICYDGLVDRGWDKISIKSEMKYIKPDIRTGQPFTIKDVNVTINEGSGGPHCFRSRLSRGRFTETTMKMKLEGALTINVGDKDTKVKLTQIQVVTTTTSDEPPVFLLKSGADGRAQGYCQADGERNVRRRPLVSLLQCIQSARSTTNGGLPLKIERNE